MTEPLLEVDGLVAGYQGAVVVRGLSLTVRPGEIVALLGANGAGKSTVLRAVSGGLPVMGGTVRLLGADVTKKSAQFIARQGLVHMTDRRGIFRGLTVAEHFRLSVGGQNLDVAAAYENFPALSGLRHRRAGLLSGGEQQMLGLARALARKPRVLLVDEFSLGLAPVIVQRLLPLVRTYVDQTGASAILVEQHVQLALDIADRGIVLARGQVVMAEAAAVLLRDRELLAASYLGGDADQKVDQPTTDHLEKARTP